MTVQIITEFDGVALEQGSDVWRKLRAGMPTASEFATVMASGKGGSQSLTRRKYLLQLAGEIVSGDPMESYTNAAMERGKAMEAEARSAYSLIADQELTRVGFVINGPKGCSPDSLIGDKGMLEIKTQTPHLLIERLLGNNGDEHQAQIQGGMWVCEREWCDLAIYWPRLPMFRRRFRRDENYIAKIKLAIDVFIEDLNEVVEKIKCYGKE